MSEDTRNIFIVIGGSLGMFVVLVSGFFMLCTLSWGLMWAMDWTLMQFDYPRAFGGEHGPGGLEILIGAFLLLSLRRLSRITRPED